MATPPRPWSSGSTSRPIPTASRPILQSGRYRDDLVRDNGGWKIERHDISRVMGRSPMDPARTPGSTLSRARVQAMEDKDAIWLLFMDYKRHLDATRLQGLRVAVHR